MLRRLLRSYGTIPGHRARIVDNFMEHLNWMKENKPPLALLYFKNSWNPECTRELEDDLLEATLHQPYEVFIIPSDFGGQGERTKKYYCVKYEPTFIYLSDGMEIKRVIGGDIKEVETFAKKVRDMRAQIAWGAGIQPSKEIWEEFHYEFERMYRDFDEHEANAKGSSFTFDRN